MAGNDEDPTNSKTSVCRKRKKRRKAAEKAFSEFAVKKRKSYACSSSYYKQVSSILEKPLLHRNEEEVKYLEVHQDLAKQVSLRMTQRKRLKDRTLEYEDPPDVLSEKCKSLAEALLNSNHLVVYTGAGISTAARIPDYRGSNGIWTLLEQGKDIGLHDLSQAEPTLTHMALYSLYRTGLLKHVVSQNCDGLHLRSGLPRTVLSEVHGNMYIEVCAECKPYRHYLRLFDVTEHTARFSHETQRLCYKCKTPLKDTIVHFGERGKLHWPLNWETACKQANATDVILCLGSSLKVLRKYPWLWCMDRRVQKRPKLYIVNLQWTPKDDQATLKINGKCDTVLELVMSHLGLSIPKYVRTLDPIFYHATALCQPEVHTTSQPCLNMRSRSSSSADAACDYTKCDNITTECDGTSILCKDPSPSFAGDTGNIKNAVDCSDRDRLNHKIDLKQSDEEVVQKESSSLSNNEYRTVETNSASPLSNEYAVETNSASPLSNEYATVEADSHDAEQEMVSHQMLLSNSVNDNALALLNYYYYATAASSLISMPVGINGYSFPSPWVQYAAALEQYFIIRRLRDNGWQALADMIQNSVRQFEGTDPKILTSANEAEGNSTVATTVRRTRSSNATTFAKDDKKETEADDSAEEEDKIGSDNSSCIFCSSYYNSTSCLFYVRYVSEQASCVYVDNEVLQDQAEVQMCLCCKKESSGNSENEDNDDEADAGCSDDAETVPLSSVSNPGWFGKGYRKRRYNRRRKL